MSDEKAPQFVLYPIGWISEESLCRMKSGGNKSRSTVPIHKSQSAVSKFPVYVIASVKGGEVTYG